MLGGASAGPSCLPVVILALPHGPHLAITVTIVHHWRRRRLLRRRRGEGEVAALCLLLCRYEIVSRQNEK